MTRPSSVLFVVPDLEVGGAERHVVDLMSGLDRARFAPSVVCIGEPGALAGELVAAGVPVTALRRSKVAAPVALGELVRRMRADRPDVVMVRGCNAEVLGRLAALLAGVPVVLAWVHQVADLRARGVVGRAVDRLLASRTSAVVGMTRAQVPYLTGVRGYRPSQVRLVPHGIEADRPSPPRAALGLDPADLVVVAVALLRPEKGHATLLDAFAQVVAVERRARLLIVGDGPLRGALTDRAARLGIADRVTFLGVRPDVPAVLAAAHVFALPSTSDCFPMAVLEAMAAGLPVVATDVGALGEIVDDGVTGRLVPPGDVGALAAALGGLLRDPDAAAATGAAGRERVRRHFDRAATLRRTERMIADELDAAGPAHGSAVRMTVVLDRADVGGAETVLLDTVRALDPARVRAHLVCLHAPGALAGEFRAAGCPVETLHRTGRFDVRTLPRLVAALRRSRTDVVLVQHHQRAALVLGRIAATLAGVRGTALAVHSMGPRTLPRYVVAALRTFGALVLLSPAQAEHLHRVESVGRWPWSRVPEWVIPNGVPARAGASGRATVRRELGVRPDDVVVGMVARLAPEKDHDTVLEAVARCTHPRVRLVLVGGGPREAELRARAAALGIDVRFTGPREDARRLLAGFDVFCLSSRREGTPMAVLEAMAAGLPVVTTACGDLPETVGDAGVVVPVGDAAALASAVDCLAADRARREALGRVAAGRAEREFRIERTARAYERMLHAVARARRAPGPGDRCRGPRTVSVPAPVARSGVPR